MYGKRRTIPLNVSVWMEKDVKVRKATASSGLMPDETRVSVFLSRQFYSDMLELSSERHRQLARFEYNRKTFLKKQKQKADTNMPGLLPYIDQYKEDLKDEPTFCRYDQFHSPSLQSMNNASSVKSDTTYPPRRRLPERKKDPQRPQISLERINQLSQPKNQRKLSTFIDRRRVNPVQASPVEEIFENIDDISFQGSFSVKEQPNPASDRRFQKLIHLFSEVYERAPTNIPAKTTLPPIERKDHRDIRNDSYLIDACV